MKILAITGIRSDYDILYPVLKELDEKKHEVLISVSGAHLSDHFSNTYKKIESDGFEIAEHDFLLRGEGDRIGKKQSGQPSFMIADLAFDSDLLEDARNTVDFISKNYPKLNNENGIRLRNLLHLFEKDVAIKTLLAG